MSRATDPKGIFTRKEDVEDDAEQAEMRECDSGYIKMKIHNTMLALRRNRRCRLVLGR